MLARSPAPPLVTAVTSGAPSTPGDRELTLEVAKMAGIDPLSCTLVTQCVNFHGHQLLKQLTSSHPKDFETLNLKEVDYKVYKARIPEISKQPSVTRNELINFISDKCPRLFVPRETESINGGDDDYGIRDRSNNLPPLEYFMRVMSHLKRDMFFKTVQRGDVLYVRVTTHVHDLLCTVKVQAAVGTTVRDLFDTDIKAHLRLEDTDPEPADRDDLGRWMLRTRLCVEVLEVDASDNYLLVGTKGVAIHSHLKDKVKLGKATLSNRPPILSEMENRSIKSYSQALEKLVTFNNPRSIRHLAGKFNLNLYSHTSLMGSLKHKFSEREMYKSVRKAQMSRWAHKSVADGVVFFKRGQHEEAFQCLNKALQIDTENVEAFVAKGALLANFGSLEKAVENFEEALKYNPTHNNAQKYICETLVELGKQLEEENKIEEAEKKFKKCLSINPNHAAGKEALRKITQKSEDRSEIVQDVLQDLMDIEEEFNSRKRHRTSSTSKSSPVAKREAHGSDIKEPAPAPEPSTQSRSRSKSLSPLSKKMQMQEGKWLPPTTINTTSSFMPPNLAVPPPSIDLAVPPPTVDASYNYPPPGWPPTTMVTAPPPGTTMYPPPTAYTMLPQGPAVSSSTYSSREDEEYKARVDQFLKNLEEDRSVEKKDRSKKKHSRGRESRSRKKYKDSHKKRNHSSSVSRSSSYSSRSSSSSSSNSSSSSTSSSSSHGSNGSPVDTKKKKHRKHKKQKKPNKKEKKKPEKHIKKDTVKEKPKSNVPPASSVDDDPIPGLESLNEKLTAYYKKVEESQREQPVREKTSKVKKDQVKERTSDNSDTITQMMNVMKSYEQGFRLTSKTKVGTSSALPSKGIHPAFQDSDEDDILDQPASNIVNKKQQAEDEKDTTRGPEVTRNAVLNQVDSTIIKKGSQSSASQDLVSKHHSRSCSRTRSKSCSRSLSKSHSRSPSRSSFRRHSKSQSRNRFQSYSRSHSRERSRSPFRHRSRSRSRSQSRSYYKTKYKGGRPHPRGRIHSYPRSRSRDMDRDGHYHEGFKWHKPYHINSRSPRHHSNRFRGRGRFGGRRGGAPFRGNSRGHQEKKGHYRGRDSPEPLSEQEREMMIQTARKKLEESIKYGAVDPSIWESNSDNLSYPKTSSKVDSSSQRSPKPESSHPKTPNRWESRHKTPSRWESSRPKTPSRWESSRPKTPSRWESSRPKTPSRWESSRPKTPSRWESSRPKTPSRWESSRPKTPSRWESSRPKTPSRWESSCPKTPSRWESSRPKTPTQSYQPKTPSRWESSRPKTPSKCKFSQPKTPNKLDSSRPKTPSKWDTSHPKTPSHEASKESKDESCNDSNDNSPHDSSENSPDRTARFGKWDNDEKGKNGESKIGNSLTEMETFIQVAKQKKLEEMKERNKEFLKPNID
ncbi:serine/arginine repetitive matrix protein 2-like isoform X4 [Portunus trituberculatus]|uniref:serine/arginine repetitive matrix protein 2-like isoform X4 n=1 Tax=Portunus trituberculatus TaxID=210409 RepID=UPI001E1CCB0A|nr:serine/arginine repetitive matrix protein 2-like isoform X4 [Portunus trituberculatus]